MTMRDERLILNTGTSIADKIKARARNTNQDAQFLLRRFATERFLVRLENSRFSGNWCLKGGLLMLTLPGELSRPTEDLDITTLSAFESDSIISAIREIAGMDPPSEDGLTYSVDERSSHTSRDGGANPGLRVAVNATLHSRAALIQLRLKIDAAHGDVISPHPSVGRFPQTCAGFEPPVMPVYPWETVVAEKIHAIMRHGFFNSRIKDFYDLVAISRQIFFQGPELSQAIHATFERRIEPELERNPIGFSSEFIESKESEWKKFIRSRGVRGDLGNFGAAVREVSEFLMPVITSIIDGEKFDMEWKPGSGWEEMPRALSLRSPSRLAHDFVENDYSTAMRP